MTDTELVVDLNKIPNANVLRFSSKDNDINFCNGSLLVLVVFANPFKAVYNIHAANYIVESKNGGTDFFDLPLDTDKNEAFVFLSSPTNIDLDKIEIAHIVKKGDIS